MNKCHAQVLRHPQPAWTIQQKCQDIISGMLIRAAVLDCLETQPYAAALDSSKSLAFAGP